MNLFGSDKKEVAQSAQEAPHKMLDTKALETTTRVLELGVNCIQMLQDFPNLFGQLVDISLKDVSRPGNRNFNSNYDLEVRTATLIFKTNRGNNAQLSICTDKTTVDVNRLSMQDVVKNTGRSNTITLSHVFLAAIELPDLYNKVLNLIHEMPGGYFYKLNAITTSLAPLIIDTNL